MDRGMIICPYCDSENIAGTDSCEHCGQSLSDLQLPTPAYARGTMSVARSSCTKCRPTSPSPPSRRRPRLAKLLKLMADKSIGCVLVTENDKLVGIFSERDAW